ncbi:MAG: TlpA family protein disulfide reductase, partial [Planctomycetota bacterium]
STPPASGAGGAGGASGGADTGDAVTRPTLFTYTETWQFADLPAKFHPIWQAPKTADGKPFDVFPLNAFGREREADRLIGHPAPTLVVDCFPAVQPIDLGPGLPAGWGTLRLVSVPRVVPAFAPLPTNGPQAIDWSEAPAAAAKIAAHPVTLGDFMKRYPGRKVAVVFVAIWSSEGRAALKALAAWQPEDPPILIVCNENVQTFVDDLGRKNLAVSVCRDPQGRNGIRFGVDAYPMFYIIDPDRSVETVLRGWSDQTPAELHRCLQLP